MIIKRFRSATVALSTILVLFAGLSFGSESKYEEGKHYAKLSVPIQTEDPKKSKLLNIFRMDVLTVSGLRGSFHNGNPSLNQTSFLREVRLYGMFRDIRFLQGPTIPWSLLEFCRICIFKFLERFTIMEDGWIPLRK